MPRSRSSRPAKIATSGVVADANAATTASGDRSQQTSGNKTSDSPKNGHHHHHHHKYPTDDNDSMNSRDKLHSIYSIDDSRDDSRDSNSTADWTFSYDSQDQGSWVKDWGGFFPAKFEHSKQRKKQFIQWKSASSRRKAANRVDAVRKLPVSVSVDSNDIHRKLIQPVGSSGHQSSSPAHNQNHHHPQHTSSSSHRHRNHHSGKSTKHGKSNKNDPSEDKIYLIPLDPASQEPATSPSPSFGEGQQQNLETLAVTTATATSLEDPHLRVSNSLRSASPIYQKQNHLPPLIPPTLLIPPATVTADARAANIKSSHKVSLPYSALATSIDHKLPQISSSSENKGLGSKEAEFAHDLATSSAMHHHGVESIENKSHVSNSSSKNLAESQEELEVLRRELKVLKWGTTKPSSPKSVMVSPKSVMVSPKSVMVSQSSRTPNHRKKNVRFTDPLVTSLQYRPRTRPEDISDLYFDEDELMELEEDRETTPRDQYEMIAQELSENRLRISIAYKNRWKPSSKTASDSSSTGGSSATSKQLNGGLLNHERGEGHALQPLTSGN